MNRKAEVAPQPPPGCRRTGRRPRAATLADERGLQPLPLGITPHKLRHTFASILVAIGRDPTYVMQQLGHTDPAFTLRVYAHMMRPATTSASN